MYKCRAFVPYDQNHTPRSELVVFVASGLIQMFPPAWPPRIELREPRSIWTFLELVIVLTVGTAAAARPDAARFVFVFVSAGCLKNARLLWTLIRALAASLVL